MKITYISHACLLVEAVGVKLLMDPWLVGPSWGGNLWLYPPPKRRPEDFGDVDYIYFSHAHEDHFQGSSLERLPVSAKRAQVLIPDFGAPYFPRAVARAGFERVRLLAQGERIELAPGLAMDMLINQREDHDSSIVLMNDRSKCFFQTDNILSPEDGATLRQAYGSFDVAFTITILTGIFPAFYDFPAAELVRLAEHKRQRSMDISLGFVAALAAKHVVPYASDLCYLGDLFFANALHRHDKGGYLRRLAAELPNVSGVRMGPEDVMELIGDKMTVTASVQDDSVEALAAFAATRRDEVARATSLERSRDTPTLRVAAERFRQALDAHTSSWSKNSFRVLWNIVDEDLSAVRLFHALPGPVVEQEQVYDLLIDLPLYRLRRLLHRDYPMGMLTLQNGSLRCKRFTSQQSPQEAQFWQWALGLRF